MKPDSETRTAIKMCGRRTIMSGEVVTFATDFEERAGVFGAFWVASGSFDVSASRDAVMVQRGSSRNAEELETLIQALRLADAARQKLG